MSVWIPAAVSMTGFALLMLQGAFYWIGIKLDRIDGEKEVGRFGCTVLLVGMALIFAGFLLQLGGWPTR